MSRHPKKISAERHAEYLARPKFRHRTSARKLAARKEKRERWLGLFRPTRDRYGKKLERVQGHPVGSKNEAKRAHLREAQKINPAIRSRSGAKKLDQKLTRESRAVLEQYSRKESVLSLPEGANG